MKCPTCLMDIDDEWILLAAKQIKKDRLTPEDVARRSKTASDNVKQRWAKYRGERK